MAVKGKIQSNNRKIKLNTKLASKRKDLKDIIRNKNTSMEDRLQAVWELDSLPRNSSWIRIRNRCKVTGRPRGYYRRFALSRVGLRFFGAFGKVVGLIKSSW